MSVCPDLGATDERGEGGRENQPPGRVAGVEWGGEPPRGDGELGATEGCQEQAEVRAACRGLWERPAGSPGRKVQRPVPGCRPLATNPT